MLWQVLRPLSKAVHMRIVNDKGCGPGVAVIAIQHIEEEGFKPLSAVPIGVLRGDVILGREIFDSRLGEVVHHAVGRKGHA